MRQIAVELRHSTPLEIGEWAVSFPYEHEPEGGRFERVVKAFKHESEGEFLEYWYGIYGISRLCLQELARHRLASFSVRSTRYTLKKAIKAFRAGGSLDTFYVTPYTKGLSGAPSDLKPRIERRVREFILEAEELQAQGYKNDEIKYLLPEAWRTSLGFKLNARTLNNLLSLRVEGHAHFEIRHMANLMAQGVPGDQRFLFEEIIRAHGAEETRELYSVS